MIKALISLTVQMRTAVVKQKSFPERFSKIIQEAVT